MFLSVFATGVQAHEGSIGVYSTMFADDCDLEIPPFAPVDLYIVYFRGDSGPDGIRGAEFKAECSSPLVNFNAFTPAAGAIPLGDVATGIGIVFDACTGAGTSTVYIGTQEIFVMGVVSDWTIRILPSPTSFPATDYPIVSQCDVLQTLHPVLGGWFHEGEGNCELAPENSSWGAIKSMYTE